MREVFPRALAKRRFSRLYEWVCFPLFKNMRKVFPQLITNSFISRLLAYATCFPAFTNGLFPRLLEHATSFPARFRNASFSPFKTGHMFSALKTSFFQSGHETNTTLNSKSSTSHKTVTILITEMGVLHLVANSPLGSPRSLSCKLELLWLLPWPRGTGLGIGKGLRGRSFSESFVGKLLKLLRRRIRPSSEESQKQTRTCLNRDIIHIFESEPF